jgi:hypothetical protein
MAERTGGWSEWEKEACAVCNLEQLLPVLRVNLQVIGSLLQEVRKPAQSPTEMKQKAQDHSVGDFPGGPPPERSAMLPEEAFQRGGWVCIHLLLKNPKLAASCVLLHLPKMRQASWW